MKTKIMCFNYVGFNVNHFFWKSYGDFRLEISNHILTWKFMKLELDPFAGLNFQSKIITLALLLQAESCKEALIAVISRLFVLEGILSRLIYIYIYIYIYI